MATCATSLIWKFSSTFCPRPPPDEAYSASCFFQEPQPGAADDDEEDNEDGELFANYDFDQCTQDEIIDFMSDNKSKLREVSLRMALKIADLRKSFPLKWKRMAETTCMRSAD